MGLRRQVRSVVAMTSADRAERAGASIIRTDVPRPLRIYFAGASGAIGTRLLPLLVGAGHTVGAMTRSPKHLDRLAAAGAEPILCDVFDRAGLREALRAFAPDLVLHQLTDLPDDLTRIPSTGSLLNARMRIEGTRNLIDAFAGLGGVKIVAQSVAWDMAPGPEADAVVALEEAVLAVHGVVLRYGMFYGPGTYFEQDRPPAPRVRIDTAAARTLTALGAPSGVLTIVDD
ncbi:NAD-dependent epimerase/dehydratase family protein [Mycolicibacterium vaccae]|nr:NAD(P)H-binding protein [Mycolicibacterium vaccae]ANI39291.1 epimerase [Mycolicibacterium vaccae 95051]